MELRQRVGAAGRLLLEKEFTWGNGVEEVGFLTRQVGEIMSDRKPRNGRAVEGTAPAKINPLALHLETSNESQR
jgi:hypothetical protein